jgi:hypothetical protein
MTLMTPAAARRAVLIPKPAERARKFFLPPMADCGLPWPFRRLVPVERQALRQIVENADLIVVEGAMPHLLIPAYPHLLEILAAFEAEIEDDENDDPDQECDDEGVTDDDRDVVEAHHDVPVIQIGPDGVAEYPDGTRPRWYAQPALVRP